MSSALVNGVRRALARATPRQARTFKTSAPKRGGGGADEPVSDGGARALLSPAGLAWLGFLG